MAWIRPCGDSGFLASQFSHILLPVIEGSMCTMSGQRYSMQFDPEILYAPPADPSNRLASLNLKQDLID